MNESLVQQNATGLESLRNAMAAGGLGKGIGQTLGISINTVDDGRVALSGAPGPEHANPMGAVHGGYLATLLDGAMALAVQTRLDVGTRYATTNLNITYVKGVPPNHEVVSCVGAVLHLGRRMALAEAKVMDDQGRLYAHATATFAIAANPA